MNNKAVKIISEYWSQLTAAVAIIAALVVGKVRIDDHTEQLETLDKLNVPAIREDVSEVRGVLKEMSTSLQKIDRTQGEQGRDIAHIKERVDDLSK